MKTAAILKNLRKNIKGKQKELNYLGQLLEYIIYKTQTEKKIEWSHENITNFMIFRYNFRDLNNVFKENVCEEILDIGIASIDNFSISQLSSISHTTSNFYPNYHEKFWHRLIEKLDSDPNQRYDYLKLFELGFIIKAICKRLQDTVILQNSLPPSFDIIKNEVIKKLSTTSVTEWQLFAIVDGMKNLQGPAKQEITNFICNKISSYLDTDPMIIGENGSFKSCIFLIQTIASLEDGNRAKEIFRKTTSMIFLKYFIESNEFHNATLSMRKVFIRSYVKALEKYKIFQLCYLDYCVLSLYEMEHRYPKFYTEYLMILISCLTYLNYPARFNSVYSYDSKILQAWNGLLEAAEGFVASSIEFYNAPDEEEDIEGFTHDRVIGNINYLWALCALDKYLSIITQVLLSSANINCEKKLTAETYSKLFQIYYWLKYEHSEERFFDPALLDDMLKFKEDWDKNNHEEEDYLEIKDIVRQQLVNNGDKFVENYHDFPYFFDFANPSEKSAIIIERNEFYLSGVDEQIPTGFYKVAEKQYELLGWKVSKVTIRTIINSEKISLISNI